MSDVPSFNDWVKQQGHAPNGKWVLARNTARIRSRYPDSTVFGQTRYNALVEEHRLLCRAYTLHAIAAEHGVTVDTLDALAAAFEAGRAA